MSKRESVDERLARLLEAPFLARIVPHLPAETLHQLIQTRGLDACAELVTSATPAQLTSLLDLDLWRHPQPGRDEQFDVNRFGEWIEVLVDTGSAVAARTVAALDKDLVIAGLSRYIRVFDPGIFEPTVESDDEPMERDDDVDGEIGGYAIRARRTDAWDAIVTLLGALEDEHAQYFHAVMRGCRRLSNSRPEEDGLDDLLQAPEQQLHDITIQREQRRSQQGYATPADARAFLEMARQPRSSSVNPIVTAYFRAADDTEQLQSQSQDQSQAQSQSQPQAELPPAAIDDVVELLTEAGVMPERPRALLAGAEMDPQTARLTHLRRLMSYLHQTDEIAYLTRSRELAFLANTLLAGCSVQSRPFTPQEASDAAAAVCNLGFESAPPPDAFLVDHDLVAAFEAGWLVLHRDVCLFAADRLIATLGKLRPVDPEMRRELTSLRRALVAQREAGSPWRARDSAEILSMLDPTVWVSMLGLLGECPVIPAALTAVLERRTKTVSPTAFEFISTAAQIADVRAFLQKLPDLLSR